MKKFKLEIKDKDFDEAIEELEKLVLGMPDFRLSGDAIVDLIKKLDDKHSKGRLEDYNTLIGIIENKT